MTGKGEGPVIEIDLGTDDLMIDPRKMKLRVSPSAEAKE
uniref:Uncharacterized protein n=1 Tax=Cucumis melo TaxID=3656 RepID=A0A9I9E6J2_CUCME